MKFNYLKVFFLQSNNALDGIGALLLYLGIVVIIFLIIREIVMWYWKINERITNQKTTIELIQQSNSLLQTLINTIEDSKNIKNSYITTTDFDSNSTTESNIEKPQNNLLNDYKKLSIDELKTIIENNTSYKREDVLTVLGILKNRNSKPPYSTIEKIIYRFNYNSEQELWIDVNKLLY